MTVTLVLLAAIMAVVTWWIVRQTIGVKPWVPDGGPTGEIDISELPWPTAKIALFVFLAVVTSLFALFISAYMMRMDFPDWRALPEPGLLWLNTGVLVLSSVAFQSARVAAGRGKTVTLKVALYAAGVFTVLFMAGQLLAWQQLTATGYLVTSNPANSFFYLITGLHGLHMLGGLVAWVGTCTKLWRQAGFEEVGLSVDLCAVYWHFLLVVWLVLFGLMLST
jgi:cytochrome c oxidase subunit III